MTDILAVTPTTTMPVRVKKEKVQDKDVEDVPNPLKGDEAVVPTHERQVCVPSIVQVDAPIPIRKRVLGLTISGRKRHITSLK